jgi:hypothetical protein
LALRELTSNGTVSFPVRFWNPTTKQKDLKMIIFVQIKKNHSLPDLHLASDDTPSPMATPLTVSCHAKIRGTIGGARPSRGPACLAVGLAWPPADVLGCPPPGHWPAAPPGRERRNMSEISEKVRLFFPHAWSNA